MGRVSANPDTFTAGLIDDFDGKIIEARTNLFTYPGTAIEVPALKVVIGYGEGFTELYEQQYAAGDMKNFVPTDDNLAFDQVGDRGFLAKSSNLGMLIASLVNSGFPKALLDAGDYNVLDGTVCHFLRQQQAESKNKVANPEGGDQPAKKRDILLVSEVKALPGGKAVTGAKATTATAKPKPGPVAVPKPAAATPTPAAAAPAADAGDTAVLDEKLQELLMEALMESDDAGNLKRPDGIKKKDLVPLVFKAHAKSDGATRNYVTKRVVQPEFLSSGPWSFVADVLAMAG